MKIRDCIILHRPLLSLKTGICDQINFVDYTRTVPIFLPSQKYRFEVLLYEKYNANEKKNLHMNEKKIL